MKPIHFIYLIGIIQQWMNRRTGLEYNKHLTALQNIFSDHENSIINFKQYE